MSVSDGGEQQVDVRLVGIPVALRALAEERHAGLMREFALIAATQPADRARIPNRLMALIDRVQQRYGGYADPLRVVLEEARARGVEAVDVSLTVPAGAAEAAAELLEHLEEADEFCRSGALLTMSATPDLVRFRRWYLGEFIRQADGYPPTPWSELPG